YTPNEIVGHTTWEFIHPDDQAFVSRRLAEAIRKPSIGIQTHTRMRYKDGSWRFLEGVLTNLLVDPGVRTIVNNYSDVTDRKLAEKSLRESEARLGGIVASAMDAIISIDESQRILVF